MESKMAAEVSPLNGRRPVAIFVEDDAEREEIGAGFEFLAERLLCRHVSDGAKSGAAAGEMSGVGSQGGQLVHRIGGLG
jgi:hypothetical protein